MRARPPAQPQAPAARPVAAAAWLLLLCLHALAAGHATAAGAPGPGSPARVYRDRVEPHWLPGNQRFWYRNDLPEDRREFVVVDAANATRYPAFHHSRVAERLAAASGQPLDAGKLPVDSLEFGEDPGSIRLRGAEGVWRLDLSSYEVTREAESDEDSLPSILDPGPSRRTGRETYILFENRLTEPVEIFWLGPEGNRVPYGRLEPGARRRQHTFAGHTWIAVRRGAVVAGFEAEPRAAPALIQEEKPVQTTARSRGNRRTSSPASRSAASTAPSPDGRWEALVRDHNLWIRDTRSGETFPLSFDGNPGASFRKDTQTARLIGMEYDQPEPPATLPEVYWAPDSRRLLALQTTTVPERRVHLVESSPRDQLQPRLDSYPYLKAGDEIPRQIPRLFDLEPRREIALDAALFPNPWSLGEFRWAPDGSRVTFLYNQRGHQVMRVLAADWPKDPEAREVRVTAIIDEVCPTFFDYSNKTYLEFLDGTGEVVWMSERSGRNHLYLFDARRGAAKHAITRGDWVIRGVERLDPERRQIWFRASGVFPDQDPYHVHLGRVNLDGTGLVWLTEGDGTHEIQWSPDRHFFVDTWSRVDLPPVTELRRAEDGALVVQLEQADASEVLATRGRFPERFVAKGRDGTTDIWGILHRPRDFDPARRYPIVENIYAGPHGQHVPKAFRATYQHQEELADRGFVVAQIDGMGTNWRDKRFHDVAWRNLGDAGFPDRIAWLKAAALRFSELDLARVGIYGGSAGGQNALRALLAHGDFYQAAVADCGCHDNRMDKIWWNEAWMGWPVGPHYAEQSNVTQAHRLRGRLLLIVGELDRNVDPASTTQVVQALVKADKDFDFLLIPGTGHGAAETDYGRRRRADFLARHLAGSPP